MINQLFLMNSFIDNITVFINQHLNRMDGYSNGVHDDVYRSEMVVGYN